MLTLETRHTYHTLLDAQVLSGAEPEAVAIVFVATDAEPIRITRRDLSTAVSSYTHTLRQHNLGDGDLIIIAHADTLTTIYAFWACLNIGTIPAIFPTLTEKLDPDIYLRHMAELVRLSGVQAILTSDDFAPTLRPIVPCPVLTLTTQAPALSPLLPSSPPPQKTAFLQHSSGTTGLQKGVALSHTAVLNQLASYATALNLQEDDVVVSWLPLYHDMGLIAGFLLPLVQGIPLVLMSPFDWVRHPALLLKAINDYGGTLCWLPNFAYNHSARRIRGRDLDGLSLATMRGFINCSEPVRQDSHELFLARFGELGAKAEQLAVSYAMAENTFAVTQTPLGTPPRVLWVDELALVEKLRVEEVEKGASTAVAHVSCGRPISGTAVRILDPGSQPLPERHVGDIVVQSDCMLTDYYRRPDLEPFQNGWYFTGDRGYLADGEVFVVGRSKDLIINAGKNVYPQDIEAIVNGVAGVHPGRVVVFGVPDEREGTELLAVVAESQPDSALDSQTLNKAIRQAVAQQSTVTVSFVKIVDDRWLIKTSSGKIARGANRAKWLSER